MRWDGGSISWSKIIRGIASSITDSAYQPNTALSPACSRATRSVAAQTQSVPVAYKRGAQQYRERINPTEGREHRTVEGGQNEHANPTHSFRRGSSSRCCRRPPLKPAERSP